MRGIKEEKSMLLVGFTGKDNMVKLLRKDVIGIAGDHGAIHVGRAFGNQWHRSRFRTPYLRNTLWDLGYGIDTLETAVTWNSVTDTLSGIEEAIISVAAEMEETAHVFSHLSHLYPTGSSIYTTYLFRLDTDLDKTFENWKAIKAAASKVIVTNQGTISHQHGVGLDHAGYLIAEKGELGITAIRSICKSIDPHQIMNPGKLVI
jgi:alkyldihydroxyacetonephosphate synthase